MHSIYSFCETRLRSSFLYVYIYFPFTWDIVNKSLSVFLGNNGMNAVDLAFLPFLWYQSVAPSDSKSLKLSAAWHPKPQWQAKHGKAHPPWRRGRDDGLKHKKLWKTRKLTKHSMNPQHPNSRRSCHFYPFFTNISWKMFTHFSQLRDSMGNWTSNASPPPLREGQVGEQVEPQLSDGCQLRFCPVIQRKQQKKTWRFQTCEKMAMI